MQRQWFAKMFLNGRDLKGRVASLIMQLVWNNYTKQAENFNLVFEVLIKSQYL